MTLTMPADRKQVERLRSVAALDTDKSFVATADLRALFATLEKIRATAINTTSRTMPQAEYVAWLASEALGYEDHDDPHLRDPLTSALARAETAEAALKADTAVRKIWNRGFVKTSAVRGAISEVLGDHHEAMINLPSCGSLDVDGFIDRIRAICAWDAAHQQPAPVKAGGEDA